MECPLHPPPSLSDLKCLKNRQQRESRPWLTVTEGGGGDPAHQLTHPPTHIRKTFFRKKMKLTKGPEIGGQFYTHKLFFWASDPPPPAPRYRSRSH